MTFPWKTKLDRSIPVIEDGISGLLHYHHAGVARKVAAVEDRLLN